MFTRYFEGTAFVQAPPEVLFEHMDDHTRFSGHMSKSSWRMGGGTMVIDTDELGGHSVGSQIRLSGRIFGIHLSVTEVVTRRTPPYTKVWATVTEPRLLVIGSYSMGFLIAARDTGSLLSVFIEYDVPARGMPRLLGRLLGSWYARWCTQQVLRDTVRHFSDGATVLRDESHRR